MVVNQVNPKCRLRCAVGRSGDGVCDGHHVGPVKKVKVADPKFGARYQTFFNRLHFQLIKIIIEFFILSYNSFDNEKGGFVSRIEFQSLVIISSFFFGLNVFGVSVVDLNIISYSHYFSILAAYINAEKRSDGVLGGNCSSR